MTQVQVDQALLQKLGGMAEPVVFCDANGTVLGHYLPEAEYKKMLYGSIQIPYSDEEIARRRAQTGGCSLRDIWNRVGQK
jgi:CRISPR/Cas system-associated endonuclease Cas1